ncbi:MAG: hypothetical protein RI907_1628 [Pseudomonadota bacterium]
MNTPLLRRRRLALWATTWVCAPGVWPGVALAAPPAAPNQLSLIERLLQITGLSLAPGQLRGLADVRGDVWVASLAGDTEPVRWTQGGGLVSPVFDEQGRVYVVSEDWLLRLDAPLARPKRLVQLPDVRKLIGVSAGEVIYLRRNNAHPVGAWPVRGGAPTVVPLDVQAAHAARVLGKMRSEGRATPAFRLQLEVQSREDELGVTQWHDLVLQPADGGPARNLSHTDGLDCAQPAIEPAGKRVAWIQVPR